MRGRIWLLLGLVATTLIGWFARGQIESGKPKLPVPEGPARADVPESEAAELPPTRQPREPEAVVPTTTPEEVLANYWGDRWPAIREKLEEEYPEFLSKEFPADQLEIPPWEEVAPEAKKVVLGLENGSAEEQCRAFVEMLIGPPWPYPMTPEFLADFLGTSPEQVDGFMLARAEEAALPFQQEIEILREELCRRRLQAMENVWASGRVRHDPLVGVPGDEDAEYRDVLMATSTAYRGWAIGFMVFNSDCQGCDELKQKLRNLAGQRAAAVRKALKN